MLVTAEVFFEKFMVTQLKENFSIFVEPTTRNYVLVMQLIGIQKVLGSNLGPETDYPV
jgi:hypothetical protein